MDLDMDALVGQLFDRWDDDRPYLTHREQTISRGQLRGAAAAEAEVFAGYGIGAGCTVALQMPPSFTQVEVLLALWQLGAQVMLLDHRLKAAEVDALHATCHPQFVVRTGSPGRAMLGFQPRYEVVTEVRRQGLPAGTDHRLVQFSSGSTGLPKVIGRTPRSLAAEIERFTQVPGMPGDGDRILLLSSTAHSFGLIGGLLHALAAGASVTFAPRVSARDILAAAMDHRVNAMFGVPMHFELLADTTRSVPGLSDLRVAVSGGEVMPPEVARRFADRFGVPVGESYGTTESGVIAMDASGLMRPSVGRAAPGVVLRVRDGGLEVALDSSPYLRGSGGTQYADGWLSTHDRATVDSSGAVHILGRSDSLVVIGGLKVDLTEVEAVLRQHPRVDQAVLVRTDVIEAYVSVDGDADSPSAGELLRWCRDRLADYKLPKVIRVLEALPRTSNGKLVRRPATLHEAVAAAQ